MRQWWQGSRNKIPKSRKGAFNHLEIFSSALDRGRIDSDRCSTFRIEVEHAWPIELFNRGETFCIEIIFWTHKRNPRSTSTMLSVSSIPSQKSHWHLWRRLPLYQRSAKANSVYIFFSVFGAVFSQCFFFPALRPAAGQKMTHLHQIFFPHLASRIESNRRRTSCYQGPEQKESLCRKKKNPPI